VSNTSRPRRLRAVTYAVILCCALGVLAATPVLATSTILRTELGILLTGATSRDATIAESPEFTAEVITGLRLDPAWIQDAAQATGISERALAAYTAATLTIQHEQPECNIGWNTLAAIGYVETRHGTIYGSALDDDGVAVPAITGPALDGGQFKGIPDSDNGALDGDTTWDRAVGPMQFIPQSWEIYGRDGNGDGIADPQNIDDAAFSAAALLCARGGDLTKTTNWVRAVHAYNQSIEYNHKVVDVANYYASATG